MNEHSILVVEDEALIAANLVQTLTILGYTVHGPVSKGKDAILAVKAQQPDLVLMDIQLNGPMNGIVAAEKIRAIVDIPIIYLTSYTDDLRLKMAELTEPYGYLVKPANSQELHATIKMALYKHALDRKLKESEEMFRSLIAASPDAIALTDVKGTMLMLNHQAEILGGYDQMDAKTGTNILTIFPPEEQENLAKNIQLTLEQGSIHSLEYTLIKRDDTRVPVELNTSVVMDPTGRQKRFLAIIRDITRRKWAEEKLQASEEKYRMLVETLNEGIWVIDKDAITTYVNPKMARILGYTMGEMTGRSLFSFMDETERLLTEGYIERRQLGLHEKHTFEFLKRDGTRIYASVEATSIRGKRGEYIGAIAGVIDITDRKKVEDALAESEERYQLLITNTHDIIATLNPDGVLTYVSPSWTELLGHPVNKVIGENMGEFIHPDDLASCQEFLETVIRTGQRKSGIEYRVRHSNGSWRWHTSNGVPVSDRTGKVIGYQAIASDITERKKAEDALRKREHDFSSLVENNTDMIVRFDTRLRHIYCNPAVERQFGVPVRQILGKTSMEISPTHEQAQFIDTSLRRVLETGEAQEVEQQATTPSGVKYFLTHIVPERDPDGSIVSLLAITRDITGRKKAEEALKESEERHRILLNDFPDPIFSFYPDGTYRHVNRAFAEGVGKSVDQIIGKKIWDVFPKDEADKRFSALRTVFSTGEEKEIEVRVPHPDGDRYYMTTIVPVKDESGTVLSAICSSKDITERKTAEEGLRLFKDFVEHSSDAIGMSTPEGRHYYQNEAFNRLFGDIGDCPPETVYVDKAIGEQVFDTIKGGGNWQGEVKMFKADRTILNIYQRAYAIKDTDGRIIGLVGLNTDISKRKKAEEELRESRDRFKATIASLDDAILLVDPATRLISECNDATTRIFGYSHEELIGRQTGFLHVDQAHVEQFGREAMATYEDPGYYTREFQMRRKDGGVFPTEHFVRPIRDSDNRILYVVSVVRDITERKKAENTIQHALAEKEVLLREVHHRVKNNLAGILSLIELQISSLSDPVQITPFKDLETRIRSMALVHESLCSAKDLARINFASYTENLTRHLLPAYGAATEVRCRIEMEDIPLPIETATPCGLVMNEIITNSLKYAFPKTFSCEEIRGEPCTIALTLHREGSDYLLGVADNGIGIPEGIDVSISHSLGLFLIRFIVEHQLRGSLEITSAGGTAYTIRFPEPKVKGRNTNEKM